MRISDWSSDVCSSDLGGGLDLAAIKELARLHIEHIARQIGAEAERKIGAPCRLEALHRKMHDLLRFGRRGRGQAERVAALGKRHHDGKRRHGKAAGIAQCIGGFGRDERRSEEHTSELQSLMRSTYAVFCLKNKS